MCWVLGVGSREVVVKKGKEKEREIIIIPEELPIDPVSEPELVPEPEREPVREPEKVPA